MEIQNILISLKIYTLREAIAKVKFFTDVVVILASDNVLNIDMRNPNAVKVLEGMFDTNVTILAHDRTLVVRKVGKK